jgi:ferric-dicitrate binding protein FerR (iron transport regulator)
MTEPKKISAESLDEAVAAVRGEKPEAGAMEAAGERVWQRLGQASGVEGEGAVGFIRGCAGVRELLPQYRAGRLAAARAMVLEAHLHECVACRREAETGQRSSSAAAPWRNELPRVTSNRFRWAMAAAAVIVLAVGTYLVQDRFLSVPAGMRARVESFTGSLYRIGVNGEQALKAGDELAEGDDVRTGGASRAMLRLADGSLVEMNERAQFAVSMRHSDTTINLDRGNIIVQAAKRKSGHLYVAAKDCRVAVTGTVFSVNSGIKGSRVSVIEGEVHVAGAGGTKVLRPGDQLSTNAAVAAVPVVREIDWSQNRDQHLALLAEFAHFANKLEAQVQMPGLRYQSKLLPLLPGDTVLYASIPNLGDAAQQANQLFQQELQESEVLRQWWQQIQAKKHGPDFQEILNEVHDVGGFIGDELVLAVTLDGREHGAPVVIAQVQKSGLKDFLAQEYANQSHLQLVDEQQLKALQTQPAKDLIVLVRPDFVAASPDVATLQQLNAALNQGSGGFAGTAFGQRMEAAYQNGAGLLLGANLQVMAHHGQGDAKSEHRREVFAQTGFADVQYLVAERKDVNGQTLNHAQLTFNGPRKGFASWLAAPAPIGGLDFVSKDATAVAAFVAKSPEQMFDDVLNIAYASNAQAEAEVNKAEAELKIRFRQDLVATLGGEITFALDGPILPTPSWKVIAEVNDPVRLQSTIQQLVADLNAHAAQQGEGLALDQNTVNGVTYYTLRSLDAAKPHEITYAFGGGFIILAPSRALVMQAFNTATSGNSLAQSAGFKSLLPQDEHANVSALLYQNLAPVLGPITQQLTPSQLQALQQLAAETKPSLVCAYGEASSIRVASTSRFFGLDLNTMALSTLLKLARPGGMQGESSPNF